MYNFHLHLSNYFLIRYVVKPDGVFSMVVESWNVFNLSAKLILKIGFICSSGFLAKWYCVNARCALSTEALGKLRLTKVLTGCLKFHMPSFKKYMISWSVSRAGGKSRCCVSLTFTNLLHFESLENLNCGVLNSVKRHVTDN